MTMFIFADEQGGFVQTFIEVEKVDMETLKEIEEEYSDFTNKKLTCVNWKKME